MPQLKYAGDVRAVGANLIGDLAAIIATDPGGTAALRVGGASALNGNLAVGATVVTNSQGWNRMTQVVGASAAFSLLDPNATAQQWDIVITGKNLEIRDVQTAGHALVFTIATLAAAFGGQITAPTIKASGIVGIGTDPLAACGLNLANAALTGTVQIGAQIRPTFSSATTVTGRTIDLRLQSAAAAFTMPIGAGIFINTPLIGAGSTITEVNGIYIDVQSGGTTNYAIQTAGGRIRFVGLPTAATGLAAGTLWSNSGVLTVA